LPVDIQDFAEIRRKVDSGPVFDSTDGASIGSICAAENVESLSFLEFRMRTHRTGLIKYILGIIGKPGSDILPLCESPFPGRGIDYFHPAILAGTVFFESGDPVIERQCDVKGVFLKGVN